ncbi:hypothetical protein QE390_003936 [Siphonobacter sp. SORGH_AS 1065]|nr:hypothetical protein [Siphonobacter sp. SORGH_AS_1065]
MHQPIKLPDCFGLEPGYRIGVNDLGKGGSSFELVYRIGLVVYARYLGFKKSARVDQ